MTLEDKNIIDKLIIDFIRDMNDWEKYCLELEEDESIPFNEEAIKQKQKLIELFQNYCTDKDRKNGSPNTVTYGEEGSYVYDFEDEEIINIEEEKNNRVIVSTTRTKPMEKKHKYVVVKKSDKWLIDSKKRYSSYKEKWENVSL
ncbi:NTF2 fold immunity protein [uncultured Aquimarina sp.]|uniref:NTF2 fold immunity protein n=1 Tax=uncultured Aquimarina sp. TaxID=575652 RepID=UPI0026125B1C|nr:NTF2 fold immunity protein [uncultured Aquimarina sp.]